MSATLTRDELREITGYTLATAQLRVLHARGFHRAFIGRHGLVLERLHYEAVCRGQSAAEPAGKPAANLGFLRRVG